MRDFGLHTLCEKPRGGDEETALLAAPDCARECESPPRLAGKSLAQACSSSVSWYGSKSSKKSKSNGSESASASEVVVKRPCWESERLMSWHKAESVGTCAAFDRGLWLSEGTATSSRGDESPPRVSEIIGREEGPSGGGVAIASTKKGGRGGPGGPEEGTAQDREGGLHGSISVSDRYSS